ncbi:MAG: CHAT domain-containing protein, partial [Chloroflexota bacterium]|nr:CHAT domain-containing protein [Chloroflexota bacterium]
TERVYQTQIDIPEEVNREALRRLAKAGYRLYQEIFYAHNDLTATRMGDRLRDLARRETLKIQIVSQQFLLPWGVLYLAQDFDENNVDPELFLGLRHIVEHIPLQQNMPDVGYTIASQPALSVGVNLDTDIDQQFRLTAVDDQIAYWDKVQQGGGAKVAVRRTADDLLTALGDPTTADQILYFYGHAVSRPLDHPEGPDSSYLGLSGGKRVTLDDLKLRAPERRPLAGAPLVFINACESAELSPLFYGGFMPYFTAKGARGMIGTECETPARFAHEWATRFFDAFLPGNKSLGEVFLQLRREFYYQHHNILGLLYALYCDADTEVVPGLRLT